MKKLISILLIVAMLMLGLCSCDLKDKISGLFGKEEETTTAPEEETTTQPQEEETTTEPGPWKPAIQDKDDKQPIELPGSSFIPTIGQ